MKRLTLAVAVAVGVMLAEAVWGQFD